MNTTRKPLTDEQIYDLLPLGIAPYTTISGPREVLIFARAIERAHGITEDGQDVPSDTEERALFEVWAEFCGMADRQYGEWCAWRAWQARAALDAQHADQGFDRTESHNAGRYVDVGETERKELSSLDAAIEALRKALGDKQ